MTISLIQHYHAHNSDEENNIIDTTHIKIYVSEDNIVEINPHIPYVFTEHGRQKYELGVSAKDVETVENLKNSEEYLKGFLLGTSNSLLNFMDAISTINSWGMPYPENIAKPTIEAFTICPSTAVDISMTNVPWLLFQSFNPSENEFEYRFTIGNIEEGCDSDTDRATFVAFLLGYLIAEINEYAT